jgi:hypothetical protein
MDKEEAESVPLEIGDLFVWNGREWKISIVKIEESRMKAYSGYPRLAIIIEATATGREQAG